MDRVPERGLACRTYAGRRQPRAPIRAEHAPGDVDVREARLAFLGDFHLSPLERARKRSSIRPPTPGRFESSEA